MKLLLILKISLWDIVIIYYFWGYNIRVSYQLISVRKTWVVMPHYSTAHKYSITKSVCAYFFNKEQYHNEKSAQRDANTARWL